MPQVFEDSDLLTPVEVAQLFRVDPKTVTRWANEGAFPRTTDGRPAVIKTRGGHRRFRGEVIRRLLDGEIEMERP
jgi:DNA-binding transcriptional MerR regulator